MFEVMRTFHTDNFSVSAMIKPDYDLDLSWDDSGEVKTALENGTMQSFQTKVAVYYRGREVGTDYLGGSIYADPRDFFKEHIGARGKYGSYFRDMIGQAIREARAQLVEERPYIRATHGKGKA